MKKVLKVLGALVGVALIAGGAVFYNMTALNRDPNEKRTGAKVTKRALVGVDGQPFDLAAAAGGTTPVLVFYRGHW